ncbi:MAG: DUF354 domain-containing protein [Methyloceanibacter sp.]
MFDIVHPSDVLFFHHPIIHFREQGDSVLIASRKGKDVTIELLDRLGHDHCPASTVRGGISGLLVELLQRDAAIYRIARDFKPDVMVGFGGICVSHVGWLRGIPSLSFYDNEIARLQMAITMPFIKEWHVCDSFTGPVPKRRAYRFTGPHHLAFFHPERFKPDLSRAIAAGLARECDNFFVRVVDWSANHDIGKRGWSQADVNEIVERLAAFGRVHISAEGDLPKEVEAFRYRGDVLDVHHLMAHCRACIGQSSTMAVEAALLGVPAVYASDDYRGVVKDLAAKGIIFEADKDVESVMRTLGRIMQVDRAHWRTLRDRLLSNGTDVANYVIAAIERYRHR